METMYVIAVKHLFDYKGNTLNCWEYVQFGECGYTFFTKSVDGAHHFYSIDKAQKWFDEIGHGLIFYGNVVLPFVDHFPKDTELYRIMTTKPEEVSSL